MTLHNIPKMFAADPVIPLEAAYHRISWSNLSPISDNLRGMFDNVIAIVYCAAVCSAPVFTALAIVRAFRHWIRKHWNYLCRLGKKRVYIFGWNQDVQQFLKQWKYENGKKYRLHIITAEEVSGDTEQQYLKNGVFFHREDCLLLPKDALNRFLSDLNIERSDKIIFFETSDSRNLSLYWAVRDCGVTLNHEISFYLSCWNADIRRVIEECDNAQKLVNLRIFNLAELKVRKMFQEVPLYTHNISNLKKEDVADWNVHLMIVGYGSIGEQVLHQAAQLGVMTGNNRILIDVIDKNALEKQSIFQSKFHDNCIQQNPNDSDMMVKIDPSRADGELCIRFHQLDVRGNYLREILRELHEKDPITYFVVCTEDPEVNIHCASEIEQLLLSEKTEKKTPVAVRLEFEDQIAQYLKRNTGRFVHVFPISTNQEVLTLKTISDETAEEESRNFHWEYNRISNAISSGNIEVSDISMLSSDLANTVWNTLPYYKKASSRALSCHETVKKLMLVYDDWYSSQRCTAGQFEDYWTGLSQEKQKACCTDAAKKMLTDGIGTNLERLKMKEIVERLSNYLSCTEESPLVEQARTEHRRWCYFTALNGWGYGPRNDTLRLHPDLCKWEHLKSACQESSDQSALCYDAISLMMKAGVAQGSSGFHESTRQ